MTWLSEIENEVKRWPGDWRGYVGVGAKRMARVIREQSEALALLKAYVDFNFEPELIGLWQRILSILSPDAKELLK